MSACHHAGSGDLASEALMRVTVSSRRRTSDVKSKEVRCADRAESNPNRCGHPSAAFVPVQPWRRELVSPTSGLELTTTGGEHVLDPIRVRSVGQCDEESVFLPEHVDRRPIRVSGSPPPVDDDAESGCPRSDTPDQLVEPDAIR